MMINKIFFILMIGIISTSSEVINETNPPGCYNDNPFSRDLKFHFSDPQLTHEKCMTECTEHEYNYFGLQAGKECYCGEKFGLNGRASDELCNTPCTGNESQICGGEWKSSIHLISYQTEVSNDSPWKLIAFIFITAFLLNCLVSCYI